MVFTKRRGRGDQDERRKKERGQIGVAGSARHPARERQRFARLDRADVALRRRERGTPVRVSGELSERDQHPRGQADAQRDRRGEA
jgi:hypothetical protein